MTKTRIQRTALIAALLLLLVSILPFGGMSFAAERSYTVTLYAGTCGTFADGTAVKTQAFPANTSYDSVRAWANGQSISVQKDANGIIQYQTAGFGNLATVSGAVTADADYVMQYNVLVDGVQYEVHFVDAASGAEIAPVQYGQAAAGEQLLFTAPAVADYALQGASQQTLTLAQGGTNEVRFAYTSTRTGNTIINTETTTNTVYIDETIGAAVTTVAGGGGGAAAATPAAPEAPEATTPEGEVIPENPTPQAPAETPADDEVIPEADVPLASAQSNNALWYALGGVGLLTAGLGVAITALVRRTKRGARR